MVPAETGSGAAWVPHSARVVLFSKMLTVPQHTNPPQKINQESISIRTVDRKTLAVKSWVGKGSFSTAFFDSIRNSITVTANINIITSNYCVVPS